MERELHDQHQHPDELLAGESANLAELHEPLLAFIRDSAVTGTRTASSMYGTRGWTAHHNADIWRHSGMVGDWGNGDPVWATWAMAGPWLAQHLYEHYLYGGDLAWLRERPIPHCAAPPSSASTGSWTTARATRHRAVDVAREQVPARRPAGTISAGATMDLALMRDLFSSTADAAEALGLDAPFRKQLLDARAKLRPYAIGAKASCSSGARSSRKSSRITGTSRTCGASTPAATSPPRRRR